MEYMENNHVRWREIEKMWSLDGAIYSMIMSLYKNNFSFLFLFAYSYTSPYPCFEVIAKRNYKETSELKDATTISERQR